MEVTKTQLNLSDIPDRMFIPAVMVRDIMRVRPLTQEEKKKTERGGPDVLAIPVIGAQCLMHRHDIIGNYTYTNGKKINVKGWQSSKLYVVVRNANETVMVMQVPLNHTVSANTVANDKNRASGDYIVCLTDESGYIDLNTASVVPAAVFRKVCYIPPNEVIDKAKNLGRHNKFFDFNAGSTSIFKKDVSGNTITPVRKVVLPPDSSFKPKANVAQHTQINNIQKTRMPQKSEIISPKTEVQRQPLPSQQPKQSDFSVVGQLLNDYGQRVGFVIQSQSGATKDIDKATAYKLCTSKKITNIVIVNNGNGGYFFRGNGISLDELPIKYV